MATVRRGWLVHRDGVKRLVLCRWPKMEDSLMMPCFCYEERVVGRKKEKKSKLGGELPF